MRCLEEIKCGKRVIIGIRDYNECEKPESGLYINDTPGITLKGASAIANEEQKSGYALLKRINEQATMLVFNDFMSHISSQFAFKSIVEIRKVNYWDGSILPKSASDRGLVLKRWRSDMAQIFIQDIYIKSADGGPVTVTIHDGPKQTSYTVTLVANEEYALRVDYLGDAEQIKITSNNMMNQMYSGQINKVFTGCGSCGGVSDGFYMTGWNGTSEEPKYFGIGVCAMVRCVEENIICRLLHKMSFLIWYRAGMLYWEELLSSNRLNPITIYSKDRAQENLTALSDRYEKAYNNFLPTIKQAINQTKGDCITCNPQIKYANTTP